MRHHAIAGAATLCLLLCVPSAYAASAAHGWTAVDSATLDSLRGGFTTPSGLEVSLGIERLVTINGTVVTRTSFHVPDVARLSAEQASQTSATLSAIKLIQNGGDNMVHAALSQQGLGGTVIQNTLDDQRIQSQTIINASANSIGLLKTLNFQASLGEAIARSAGPR